MGEYNSKHTNTHRAALRYLAQQTYAKQRRNRVAIRIKISIFFFSLALAALLRYLSITFGG